MHHLDPKAVWIFFINSFVIWIVVFLFFGAQTIVFIGQLSGGFGVFGYVTSFVIMLILFCILSYTWAKLSYRFYKYELIEDGFRKEHGVIWKKYITIPYDRIQNVDIHRGVFARILKLSDLHIQTAGSSSNTKHSEGRLPGLSRENAETIRDELISRARQSKNQGL